MKYSQAIKYAIEDLAACKGWSSRAIAAELGISKSGVNNYLNQLKGKDVPKTKEKLNGPRILILDVETAAATALTFGRFKVNLSQDNIVTEGGWILCASYKWLDSPYTYSIWLTPEEIASQDDSRIVTQLMELYEEADAMVAHNGCSFDHKVIQARATANGFGKLSTVKVLDTLLLAKRYLRLPSNKLDSIGEYFGLGRKIDTGGISLWKRVQAGDEDAMQEMVDYCVQDVELLTGVYLKLRGLGTAGNSFNAALYYYDDEVRCTVCGSTNVQPTGKTAYSTVNSFEEYVCKDCGCTHRSRTGNKTKEKRKSLLALTN
jgi:hypothetical protein